MIRKQDSLRRNILLPVLASIATMIVLVSGLVMAYELFSVSRTRAERHLTTELKILLALQRSLDDQQIAWQNVLLRGMDAGSYHDELRRFYANEREVRASLEHLASSNLNKPAIQDSIRRFSKRHQFGGQKYREAIRVFNTATLTPHRAADEMVRGLHDELDLLVDDMHSSIEDDLEDTYARLEAERAHYRNFAGLIILALAGLTGAVLYRSLDKRVLKPVSDITGIATGISKGAADRSIEVDRHDELGILQAALEEMRVSLVASRNDLVKSNESLEHRVLERTEELRQALENAEAANQAKSIFLANMSHELRTPLNGVLGMAPLIQGRDISEKVRGYAKIIETSGNNLLGQVNNLLDLAKLESGKSEVKPTTFNLQEKLTETLSVLDVRARDKNLTLIIRLGPDLPDFVTTDPDFLWHILTNVVGNAIKFTHDGQIEVIVEVSSSADQPPCLELSIIDTGIGIPESELENIFSRFQQVESATTRQFGGSGLGLAIVRELVDLLEGSIEVSRNEPRGTRFHFSIPVQVNETPDLAACEERLHAEEEVSIH